MIGSILTDWLIEPEMKGVSLDSDRRFAAHAAVFARKPIIQGVFHDFHRLMAALDKRFFKAGPGLRVELGAGVSPMRDSDAQVMATDLALVPGLDRQLDATKMDLPDQSVHALYAQNCFHHFPSPEKFFCEAERVLVPGGGIILIEPYFGPLASFIYGRLFRFERYDKTMQSWDAPMTGPMGGANPALSYIVFWRDREKFGREFPGLNIVHTDPLGSYLRYILSGGLNFRQLVPDFMERPLMLLEAIIMPLRRWLAINHVIVIRKN